jgi:hypothetical protein
MRSLRTLCVHHLILVTVQVLTRKSNAETGRLGPEPMRLAAKSATFRGFSLQEKHLFCLYKFFRTTRHLS